MEAKLFSASLDYLYEMLDFVKAYGAAHQIPDSKLEQIVLATEEALVNVISYAYPGAEKGNIEIICDDLNERKGIKIIIKDQGLPFNPIKNIPSELPPPITILEKCDESFGGYGIYIFTGLMDSVEYQRNAEMNILILKKFY